MARSKKILYQLLTSGILYFTIVLFFITILLIIFHHRVHDYFYGNWVELAKMIGTTTVGGVLAYCIIWVAETKRDQHRYDRELLQEKKKANAGCTQVLLTVQMTISSQIEELRFLEKICSNIINFSIADTTLGEIHRNHKDPHVQAEMLRKLLQAEPEKFKELVSKTKHIPTKHMLNNIIHLPFAMFGVQAFSHANREIAEYIHDLSRCNRKYMKIISFTERQNEIRDLIVIHQTKHNPKHSKEDAWEGDILLIVGMLARVCRLHEKIGSYFATADAAFNQTAAYVKKLGLSVPIYREA